MLNLKISIAPDQTLTQIFINKKELQTPLQVEELFTLINILCLDFDLESGLELSDLQNSVNECRVEELEILISEEQVEIFVE